MDPTLPTTFVIKQEVDDYDENMDLCNKDLNEDLVDEPVHESQMEEIKDQINIKLHNLKEEPPGIHAKEIIIIL